MRAGPFLLFASREQRKCRKERTITKPLLQGLDVDIGRRIKLRRIQLGLSQSDLARKIGPVAFQQVQKYENGTDRVSASRLYLIAEALGVGIGFFYGRRRRRCRHRHRGRRGLDRLLGRAGRDRGPSNASAT